MSSPIPAICASCRRPYGGYFEVTSVDRNGVNRGAVRVCSLRCLVTWAYANGTERGLAIIERGKGFLAELLAALKGPPG